MNDTVDRTARCSGRAGNPDTLEDTIVSGHAVLPLVRSGTDDMAHSISESAWKDFRALREEALRLLCERALGEVRTAIEVPGRSEHERFRDVLRIVNRRNVDVARAFDNPRRSGVVAHLVAMRNLELLTPELVGRCGPALRDLIHKVEQFD